MIQNQEHLGEKRFLSRNCPCPSTRVESSDEKTENAFFSLVSYIMSMQVPSALQIDRAHTLAFVFA
jgi:hypothetical protein